eukprot:gene3046-3325_t
MESTWNHRGFPEFLRRVSDVLVREKEGPPIWKLLTIDREHRTRYQNLPPGPRKTPCVKIMTSITSYGSPEEGIVLIVQERCREVHCPIWTLGSEERERLNKIKGELIDKLNKLPKLQIKLQGSIVKNTAIPGFADFDFILELKRSVPRPKLRTLRNEIKASLEDSVLLYGEGAILTFFYKDVTFDVMISWPEDRLIQQVESNLNDIVTLPGNQRNKYHAYMRALKYFCKRSGFPIKSFAVEYAALYLLRRNPNTKLREFLEFLQRGDWSDLSHCVPEGPKRRELQTLATQYLRYLR